MGRKEIWCLAFFLVSGVAKAADVKPTDIVQDQWEVAYLGKSRAGFVHTVTRVVTRGDRKYYRTTSELNLTVKRFQDTATLRMETGTEEDQDGKVTGVSMRQFLGKGQETVMEGTVGEQGLHIVVHDLRDGEKTERLNKVNPWKDDVLGLHRQQSLYKDRKVKPGDQFSYLSYEPTLTLVVTTNVHVKDYEEVEIQTKKRRLLRVEAIPEKIQIGDNAIQLPALVAWLDGEYGTLRSEVDVPGLGQLTLYRSTRGEAGRPIAPNVAAVPPDIGTAQLVRLDRRIPRAYDAEDVLYHITLNGDADAASAFVQDPRQKIENADGDAFDLHVRARRQPQLVQEPGSTKDEYLGSSFFINANDEKVKTHAAAAIRQEMDPWKKALLIERWVHRNLAKKNYSEAFATADHVARSLEGDCTEHAVLAAAMCRAAGVPARTAIGLIYIENGAQPAMGFHMWTEVWVRGQWMPIDATLGKGFVGATHIKVSDHSWHDVQTVTPLLPVVRVVGKVRIQVVSTGGRR